MKYILISFLMFSCTAAKSANDVANELCSVVLSATLPADQAAALCLIPEVLKPFLTKGNPEDQKAQALSAARTLKKIP